MKIVLIAAEKKEKDRRKFVCYFRRDSEFKQLTTKNLTDPCLVRGLKIWFGITNPAVQNHPQECARKIGSRNSIPERQDQTLGYEPIEG